MNINKVIKCTILAANHPAYQKLPIIIAGESGIGKTEMLLQYATQEGFYPWVLQLNHTTTDQLYGRIPEGQGWKVNPSIDFPTTENVEIVAKEYEAETGEAFPEKVLLIIDECNRTKYKALINAVGAMISTRMVVNRSLHPSVRIVGTCNLEPNQDVLPFDKAFATRVIWMMAEPDAKDTAQYLNNKHVETLFNDLSDYRQINARESWRELMIQIGENHAGSSRQIEKLQLVMPEIYELYKEEFLTEKEIKEIEFGFMLSKDKRVLKFLQSYRKSCLDGESFGHEVTAPKPTPKKRVKAIKEISSIKEVEGRGNDLELRASGIQYIDKILNGKGTQDQNDEIIELLKTPLKDVRKNSPRACSIIIGKKEQITEVFWELLEPNDRKVGSFFREIIKLEIENVRNSAS